MVTPARCFIWPLFAIHPLLWTGIDQERAHLPRVPSVWWFNSFSASRTDSACRVYIGNGNEVIGIFKGWGKDIKHHHVLTSEDRWKDQRIAGFYQEYLKDFCPWRCLGARRWDNGGVFLFSYSVNCWDTVWFLPKEMSSGVISCEWLGGVSREPIWKIAHYPARTFSRLLTEQFHTVPCACSRWCCPVDGLFSPFDGVRCSRRR